MVRQFECRYISAKCRPRYYSFPSADCLPACMSGGGGGGRGIIFPPRLFNIFFPRPSVVAWCEHFRVTANERTRTKRSGGGVPRQITVYSTSLILPYIHFEISIRLCRSGSTFDGPTRNNLKKKPEVKLIRCSGWEISRCDTRWNCQARADNFG